MLSVEPTKIVDGNSHNSNNTKIRLDIDIYGKNVILRAQQYSKYYPALDPRDAIYAIYDPATDKMTVHVPIATTASRLLI